MNAWLDDDFVVALNIILRHFALVFLGLFLKVVHREFLLEQDITLVLLIGKHPANGCSVPFFFASGQLNAHLRQSRYNAVRRHALKESSEYQHLNP